jgi:RNA polymerase sigma-70 factor (ECF subfamily)
LSTLRTLASGVPEAEVIERAKHRDAQAFETLYGLHKRRVCSLCLRMTGNIAEAEDLTQEPFCRCTGKLPAFAATQQPRQEDGPKKDIGTRDKLLTGCVDRITLQRASENLPPGYRIVFVLHDVEGYYHEEIANMMDCSIGNSKSQLHKARLKLRQLLKLGAAARLAMRYAIRLKGPLTGCLEK